MSDNQPTLPYPEPGGAEATAGWSGSDTSHERAVRERDDGTVTRRQTEALRWLGDAEGRGLTWKELADLMGWHHGQASGVLSVLHKDGRIARLVQRRNRCHVYVAVEYVNGRETQPFGRVSKPDDSLAMALADLARFEAAIARVEEVCESWERATDGNSPAARVIRAAIKGDDTR